MDQEISALRKSVTERDEEISQLQFELQQAKRNEKLTAGSGSLQLSTAKDESRMLRIANERLREQIDELEYTLNQQQSILIESNYAAPNATKHLFAGKRSQLTNSSKSVTAPDILPSSPSPIKLSSLDIVMGDTEVSEPEHVRSIARQESPVSPDCIDRSPRNRSNEIKFGARSSIAKEAANAATERENSVRPIVNRRDGSFGLSPTRIKTPPSSVEKWAYSPKELTDDSKFGRPTLSPPKHLPIQPTKWPGQDDRDIIKIFNFSDLNDDDKVSTKALLGAKDRDSDEDFRHVRVGYAYNSEGGGIIENETRQKERSYHSSRSEAETTTDFQRLFKNPKGKTLRA
jgi:hypothetical protein